MPSLSNKLYIMAFYSLFLISTAIVLMASTAKTQVPLWGGYIDVGIVVLLAAVGFTIHQRHKGNPQYEISHHVAVYLVPSILVGMWIFRNSLDFNILLPGLAWRTYFFLSILPHALPLWKLEPPQ
jgi:hypothetical protein